MSDLSVFWHAPANIPSKALPIADRLFKRLNVIKQYGFIYILVALLLSGCASYQPTKNAWKTTKGLWNTYVSSPATIDYDDRGDLPERAQELSRSMMNIDQQLARLERVMHNADRPPTQQWLNNLFMTFPWITGVVGVRYDGVIVGQEPPDTLKDLDFNRLLYEDQKQSSRALRTDVEPGPLGPEIMLAAPLYDGVDFLGVVGVYFDLRNLVSQVGGGQNLVVLCPAALLWPGRFDYAETPLAGVDWETAVRKSTSGTCSNANGSFFYMVRYLGNLPLVFAVPEQGEFPEGNGDVVAQGAAFFPQEREKMAPPPAPERAPRNEENVNNFGADEDADLYLDTGADSQRGQEPDNDLQPGSPDSVLLRHTEPAPSSVQERALEGENVPVQRVQRVQRPRIPDAALDPLIQEVLEEPEPGPDFEPMQTPSPFGPRGQEPASDNAREEQARPVNTPGRISPFGPVQAEPDSIPNEPEADSRPAPASPQDGDSIPPKRTETGTVNTPGRISPFGPREEPASQPIQEGDSIPEAPVEMPVQPSGNNEATVETQAGDRATSNETIEPVLNRRGRPSPFGPR